MLTHTPNVPVARRPWRQRRNIDCSRTFPSHPIEPAVTLSKERNRQKNGHMLVYNTPITMVYIYIYVILYISWYIYTYYGLYFISFPYANHGAGIFTYKTGWLLGQMLVNIPAPWSISISLACAQWIVAKHVYHRMFAHMVCPARSHMSLGDFLTNGGYWSPNRVCARAGVTFYAEGWLNTTPKYDATSAELAQWDYPASRTGFWCTLW